MKRIDASELIAMYKTDCSRFELLSKHDQQQLGERARSGDREAIDALVVGNLRLVMMVAKKYRGRGVDYEDLVEEGNIGLMHAARHFDPAKGMFSTYAYHAIERAIQRCVSDQAGPIRLPAYLPALVHRWHVQAGHLMAAGEADASAEEIGAAAGLTPGQTECVLQAIRGWGPVADVVLEEIVDDDQGDELPGGANVEDLRKRLEPLLARLSPRDREVISLWFGLNGQSSTLTELGERYGMSKQGVQLIKQRAIARLRAMARSLALAS